MKKLLLRLLSELAERNLGLVTPKFHIFAGDHQASPDDLIGTTDTLQEAVKCYEEAIELYEAEWCRIYTTDAHGKLRLVWANGRGFHGPSMHPRGFEPTDEFPGMDQIL